MKKILPLLLFMFTACAAYPVTFKFEDVVVNRGYGPDVKEMPVIFDSLVVSDSQNSSEDIEIVVTANYQFQAIEFCLTWNDTTVTIDKNLFQHEELFGDDGVFTCAQMSPTKIYVSVILPQGKLFNTKLNEITIAKFVLVFYEEKAILYLRIAE